MAAVSPTPLTPTYAAVLDGLRRVCHRQVVRYRHASLFDTLVTMGFLAWTRQPVRLSQQVVSVSPAAYHAPVEIAALTDLGRIALDWLVALESTPHWETLRARPYGTRDYREAP